MHVRNIVPVYGKKKKLGRKNTKRYDWDGTLKG